MTKKELKKLMDQHNIIPSELDDIIDFVSALLYMRRKELEDNVNIDRIKEVNIQAVFLLLN